LCRILNQVNAMKFTELDKWIHVGTLAVQMNRKKGFRLVRNRTLNLVRIYVEGALIDIDKNRPGLQSSDCTSGGKETKWRRDHFVAGFNAAGHQGEQERI